MTGHACDVVIVGGRCAGAALATYLARDGASVVVLERDARGTDQVLSTHTIHPPGMDVLDELGVGEEVRAVFDTRDYSEGRYLVLATREGMVKKTELRSYDTILREKGLTAIKLDGDDELVGVARYDRWPTRSEAEVAFFVDDRHTGRGMATLLLEYLAAAARRLGRVHLGPGRLDLQHHGPARSPVPAAHGRRAPRGRAWDRRRCPGGRDEPPPARTADRRARGRAGPAGARSRGRRS